MDLVPQTWEKRLHRGKWRFSLHVLAQPPGGALLLHFEHLCPSSFFLFFSSNSLSVLLAGPVQHLTPTVCALTGHQRTGSFLLLVDFGFSTCFVTTSAHQTGKLLQQIDLIFQTTPPKWKCFECAEVPAVCGEVASIVYVYVYIYTEKTVVGFSLFCLYLCCAVLLCFSSAVIKTLLILFGHWLSFQTPFIIFCLNSAFLTRLTVVKITVIIVWHFKEQTKKVTALLNSRPDCKCFLCSWKNCKSLLHFLFLYIYL